MSTMTLTWTNDDDEEVSITVPSRMEVCWDCNGDGSVLIDGMREHAYSQEEFEETFWDEEDREAYFTPGSHYHRECPTCHGKNVMPMVNEEAMKHVSKDLKEQYEAYCEWKERNDRFEAEYRAECEMERKLGC